MYGLPWIAPSRYSSFPALMPLTTMKPESTPYCSPAVTSLDVFRAGEDIVGDLAGRARRNVSTTYRLTGARSTCPAPATSKGNA